MAVYWSAAGQAVRATARRRPEHSVGTALRTARRRACGKQDCLLALGEHTLYHRLQAGMEARQHLPVAHPFVM